MNKFKIFNNTTIKLIAITLMLLNHIERVFFPDSTLFVKIGEIGFPLFAFCIAEGFYYTRNRKKYLRNLFLFAVISEIFFDFALYHKINWIHQNVLFTFVISVLFLMLYEYINTLKKSQTVKSLLIVLSFIVFLFISTLSFTDHNTYGLILIFIFYVFRDKPIIKYPLSAIILLISYKYGYALLSIPILMMYNGKKGYNLKYFFYAFYPVHLFILYVIWKLIN